MQPTDVTIEILKGIRDEVRTTNARIDALRADTNARFEELRSDTNARIDETNTHLARLEHRQLDSEMRVSTLLTGVAETVGEVRDLLREDRVLRNRVDDHERRLGAIEKRF